MDTIIDTLISTGIFPWGHNSQALYEERINRYFEREYKRVIENQSIPELIIDEGPLAKHTAELMDDHYDSELPLFTAFLDPQYMAYTMAYYGETKVEVLDSLLTLEQAQTNKFNLICNRVSIDKGNERVLSIGCGFGPLETYLFSNYPELKIDSITPSTTQSNYIQQLVNTPDHPLHDKRFKLYTLDLEDYVRTEVSEQSYDIIFAIGVFEHISNISLALEIISSLLKPGGKLFIHSINSVPTFERYLDAEKSLIGKYFPGGKIWPMSAYPIQHQDLSLKTQWFVNGFNYWKTLDEWHRLFWLNIDSLFGSALDEAQVRHWNDYFTLCKGCFHPSNGELFGNGHFLYQKED